MALHPEIAKILATLPAPPPGPLDPAALRAGEEAQVPPLAERLPLHAVEDTTADGVPIRLYTPDTADTHGILVYFAAFKNHIGFYPPVRGDAELEQAVAPYAGEKGNLRFAMDKPLPLELIERITRLRVRQDQARGRR